MIDFSYQQLLKESIIVGLASKGVFRFSDLKEMEIDDYLQVVKDCVDVKNKLYGGE